MPDCSAEDSKGAVSGNNNKMINFVLKKNSSDIFLLVEFICPSVQASLTKMNYNHEPAHSRLSPDILSVQSKVVHYSIRLLVVLK